MELTVNNKVCYIKTNLNTFITYNLINPNIQRLIDKHHVDDIVSYQIDYVKKYGNLNLGCPFVVAELDNTLYLLDGHHRLTAARRLLDFIPNIGEIALVYQLNKVTSQSELQDLFSAICHNMPVDEWHMDILNIRDENEKSRQLTLKSKVDDVMLYFNERFPDILRVSKRPMRPNMNREDFYRNILEDTNLLNMTSDQYFKQLLEHNEELKSKFDHTKFTKTTCVKFEKSGCFLSLDKYKAKKTAIPKYIRSEVWERLFGRNTNGTCTTCKCNLTVHQFEVGHIISEKNGGTLELENLTVQCSMCNKSAGSKNLS